MSNSHEVNSRTVSHYKQIFL